MNYARNIARELALLTLTQLMDKENLDSVRLRELLEQAIRLLTSEAEECLKIAGKAIETANDMLLEADLRKDQEKIQNYLQHSTEKLSYAVELISLAFEWPLYRTLSDMPEIRKFTLFLVKRYQQNHATVDNLINSVSEEWPLERMHSLDRDLIRLAVTEMLYVLDIPLAVAINEAVDLAKKYGTDESHRFVNGVLKNVLPYAKKERENVSLS